jgi:O-antigen/teichoic acid export membrane protein
LKQQVKKIKNSSFAKNILTVASGSMAAQLISILSTFVLAAIYSAHDFGVLGLYMSIALVANVFGNLRFSQAILLEEKEKDCLQVIILSVCASILVSCISLVLLIFCKEYLATKINAPGVSEILLTIPISIFFTSINEIFSVYSNRKKKYKQLSISRVTATLVQFLLSLLFAFIGYKTYGLIVSYLLAQFVSAVYLFLKTELNLLKINTSIYLLLFMAKKHKKFAFFSLPSDVLNMFTNQMPVYFLSGFGSTIVGQFNMSVRLLTIPITIVSAAIGEVFRQAAAQQILQNGNCRLLFLKTFKTLSILSIIPFIALVFLGPWLFSTFLGSNWRIAGVYAQYLSIMYLFKFIASTLSYIYYIKGKQLEDFFLHLTMIAGSWVIFKVAQMYNCSDVISIFYYGLFYAFIYIVYLVRSYQFSK